MSDATSDSNRWERKDVGLGLLFLFAGALVIAFAGVMWGLPTHFRLLAAAFGVLMSGLGMNAIVRSLRARK